uniref:Uncharacterized protein n=1 Tax=Anthurium amnicola TaxID=1678845 RepID=A0A1D1Y6J3_9ARAE
MDSVEDEVAFPLPEEPSPPIHHRKLRRLKKASAAVADVPTPMSPADGSAPASSSSDEQGGVDVADGGAIPDPARSADAMSPAPGSGDLDKETYFDDGLDPLFADASRFDGSGFAALGSEAEEPMFEDLGREGDGSKGILEVADGTGKKRSAKKRLSMEGVDGKPKKKRMASGKRGKDGKAEESARNKRKLEKERNAHLERLHAESQRLLRETRDASFKPVILVGKPISSVLEKIRQRKLEISNSCGSSVSNDSDMFAEADSLMLKQAVAEGGKRQYSESPEAEPVVDESDRRRYNDSEEVELAVAESDSRQHSESTEVPGGSSRNEDQISVVDEIFDDSQHCKKESDRSDNHDDKLPDNDGVSSLLATDLNLHYDSSDDTSSDEEGYNKENIDPCPDKLVNVNLYRKNDLVKAFVDEEAEEEDDSDHDLMRFKENDDDEESEEDEILDDLIATGCEEMPLDDEKRNELHQKWLEQQDAAATENVLRRLNCGKKQRDPLLVHDVKDGEEPVENSSEESLNVVLPANSARQRSRKAKQVIVQMVNDAEDVYISSDDEETEQRLFRQRLLLQQTEEKSSLLSPVEDEPTREFFGLIRKLNTVPDLKRKTRSSTVSFDMSVTRGNTSTFKSSFLGRTTSNSLASSHKCGTAVTRSFIFGRDDSNSRSSFSSSENTSDMSQANQLKKTATVKYCSSQTKSVGPKRKAEADTSGASLFEILHRTSVHFDEQLQISDHSGLNVISGTQAARQFTAFKLSRKTSKKLMQEA